ncbi:MAG: SIR2 family NAD-dependent protein deacylase [Thermodesulfobacteriota bacterium]
MEELIKKAAEDLIQSKYAIALTGAGISTESGIPDFRGPNGIWNRDPEAEKRAYEIYDLFLKNPKKYWLDRLNPESFLSKRIFSFFKEIDKANPNRGHRALAELEKLGILKWVITQNVDGLHQKAGSKRVIEYHGGLNKFRCIECNRRFNSEELDLEGLNIRGELPPHCSCGGLIKDDGVFFGEPIPSDMARRSLEEAWKCDLMLICGTSGTVYPFAQLPRIARERRVEKERRLESGLYIVERVPATVIIEVNMEPTPLTWEKISDYLIQGKSGEILQRIVEEVKKGISQ